MYCTDPDTFKARKLHVCMSCGQCIEVGETYKRWRSYDGGDAGTSKMHPECLAMHQEEGDYGEWEYTPFSYERPEAVTPNV